MKKKLMLYKNLPLGTFDGNKEVQENNFDDVKQWIRKGLIFKSLFRYQEATLYSYRADLITKPFVTTLLLMSFSKNSFVKDMKGSEYRVTFRQLARLFAKMIKERVNLGSVLKRVSEDVKNRTALFSQNHSVNVNLNLSPIYFRTDLWFGVKSGGSVGHIAGVLNNLENFTKEPVFFSTDFIPTVKKDIKNYIIPPTNDYWDFKEMPSIFLTDYFYNQVRKKMDQNHYSFIYQRYSMNNYSGVKLAQQLKLPFVLEYNGSEIWISRNWGKPLKYEALSERIEYLNLLAANVIVVVSKPMKEELVSRGIEAEKILVNPNGVDSDLYHPDIKGDPVRDKYNLNNKVVIGFIGTFGKWHGAEMLANAYAQLLRDHPDYASNTALLMIGDGVTLPEVRNIVRDNHIQENCILTGLIPQSEGPVHLAACDILVSPHVPNADGSPFFGSPTKLFEYMAMGKGIVASKLDQIGEILEHNKTAFMVEPGDSHLLMTSLKELIDNEPLRRKLGEGARKEAEEKYTWRVHTEKIIEKIKERCE